MALIIPSYNFKGVTLTNLYTRPCHFSYDHTSNSFAVIFGIYADEAASDIDDRIDDFSIGLVPIIEEGTGSILTQVYANALAKSVSEEIPIELEEEPEPEP